MTDNKALISKATDWLSAGGLFNAELMDPDETAQLVADLRDALKGPVIDDDMVERALDFWFTEPESTGINYGDWRKWSTAQQQRDTMRNALTAALHIPIAELNQLVSGVDLEEPTNAE